MKIYGLKTCDTCKKARKALSHADFIDVRSDGISKDILEKAFEKFQMALLNTRSTTWRNLDETQRQEPPLALLEKHPTLMKRPLIFKGEQMYLGWSKDTQAQLTTEV